MIEKYNIDNNYGKVDKNFFKDKNLRPVDFEILVYIHSLHTNTKLTQKMISDTLPISKNTVEKSIENLKKLGYLEIIEIGLHEYKYVLKNPRAKKKTDAGTKQDKKADAGTKQDKKTDADAGTKQDKKADAGTKQDIQKVLDIYNSYKGGIFKHVDKLTEEQEKKLNGYISECGLTFVVEKLEEFLNTNEYIGQNQIKFFVEIWFNGLLHKEEVEKKKAKSNNRFNNFTQRNYSKKDFQELEKSFFNNSDVGADAEEEQQEKNKVKYIAVGTSKEIAETYIKDRGLEEYKNNIFNDIDKIHDPSNAKEYKRALELECRKYKNIMIQNSKARKRG